MKRTITFRQAQQALRDRHDLASLDIAPRRIPAAIADERIRRIRQGAYVEGDFWRALHPEGRHLTRVAAAFADVGDSGAVAAYGAAAVLHSLPLYLHEPEHVDVMLADGHRASNSARVRRHAIDLPDDDVVEIDGIRVTSLARTLVDVARTFPVAAALACVDAGLGRIARSGHVVDEEAQARARDDLRLRLGAMPGARGVAAARRVVEFAHAGAETPIESGSRLQLHRLGFAQPRLQVPVAAPGGGWLWIDLGLDDVPAWGEVDGATKYLDEAMRAGRSAEQVVWEEKRREDHVRARTRRPFARWGAAEAAAAPVLARRLRGYGILPPARPAGDKRPRFL